MNLGRKTLGLPKNGSEPSTEPADVVAQVGIYDVLLPSRRFDVHHKVAVLGEVALTTEFLLRLLHAVDGMYEADVATFFNFSDVEIAFVLQEAEERAYISRSAGRLWLTDYGYSLFKDGEKPQIYSVERRKERIGFDLLSLAPCEWEFLSEFEVALPELDLRDKELAAKASQMVPESFRRFYAEIASKKDRVATDLVRRSLYSVDEVVAGDRFSGVVPIVAECSTRMPGEVEAKLEAWRPGDEVKQRESIVHGIAAFLDGLKTVLRPEDAVAYQMLMDVAPEYLKDFAIRRGFSAQRYFREIASRAGELRKDRQTIGLLGPMWLLDNRKRLTTALALAEPRAEGADDLLLSLAPDVPAWGATRAIQTFLDSVRASSIAQLKGDPEDSRVAHLIVRNRAPRHLTKAYEKVLVRAENGGVPGSMEIFLVPQRVAAVLVHAPVVEGRGFPVPMGVLSCDPAVVREVHALLVSQLPARLNFMGSSAQLDLQEVLEWKPVAPKEQLHDGPTESRED